MKNLRLEVLTASDNWLPVGATVAGVIGQRAMRGAVMSGPGADRKRARIVDPDTNQVVDFYVG